MVYRAAHWVVCLTCASAALAGCRSTEAPVDDSLAVAATMAVIESSESSDHESSSAATVPSSVAPDAADEAAADPTTSTAQFAPPYPDRQDPFEPPKRAAGTVRRDEERGESVELKGFINVDQPRVVLSIDGVTSPIAEGGEKYGVQVIAIQPPSVVLQRGRSRWTATLE